MFSFPIFCGSTPCLEWLLRFNLGFCFVILGHMLSNYEMSSVCVDVGVMWRLSEDLNRRFAARVQQHHHHPHHVHHRPGTVSMIYNGISLCYTIITKNKPIFGLSFCAYIRFSEMSTIRHSFSPKFHLSLEYVCVNWTYLWNDLVFLKCSFLLRIFARTKNSDGWMACVEYDSLKKWKFIESLVFWCL